MALILAVALLRGIEACFHDSVPSDIYFVFLQLHHIELFCLVSEQLRLWHIPTSNAYLDVQPNKIKETCCDNIYDGIPLTNKHAQ